MDEEGLELAFGEMEEDEGEGEVLREGGAELVGGGTVAEDGEDEGLD